MEHAGSSQGFTGKKTHQVDLESGTLVHPLTRKRLTLSFLSLETGRVEAPAWDCVAAFPRPPAILLANCSVTPSCSGASSN